MRSKNSKESIPEKKEKQYNEARFYQIFLKNIFSSHRGETFAFFEGLLWAIFPLLVVSSLGNIPPLFFAGLSTFLAGVILFFLFSFQKRSLWIPKKHWKDFFFSFLIIMVWIHGILFWAGQHTNSGNIAIIGQSEVVFSLLFFGLLGLEKISLHRIIGAGFILLGTGLVLFQSFSGSFEPWDLWILAAFSLAPLGNYFQKRIMTSVSPFVLLFWRNTLGGIFFLGASLLLESPSLTMIPENATLILMSAILIFILSKWCWLSAIHHIGVSKTITIVSISPIITVLLAFFFLGEKSSTLQLIGLALTLVGVPFAVRK